MNTVQTSYTASQFALFRIIFGIYLTWHFATLIPYSSELFSKNGIIPNPKLNPTSEFLSTEILFYVDSSEQVTNLLYTLIVMAILFSFGILRRITSLYLWCGWAYLFLRNNFIANPGIPYVGWLLLICAIVPSGEGYCIFNFHKKDRNWNMPPLIYWSAWFLMAFGYTISGIHKLQCISWIDGSALIHVFNSMLARDNFLRTFFLSYPILLRLCTWISLLAEILFLPLGLFHYTRQLFWLLFMGLHVGILMVINFTDLTLGVLMIHLFTFDHRWVKIF